VTPQPHVPSHLLHRFLRCFQAVPHLGRRRAPGAEKIVSQTHIKALSAVTVNIFLPCLIVVKTVSQFDPSKFAQWWLLPLSGGLIALTGLGLAFLLFGPGPEKRAYISLASFQNAIYIVLPIGQLVFPNQFDQLALYCFLLIFYMKYSVNLWIISSFVVGRPRSE